MKRLPSPFLAAVLAVSVLVVPASAAGLQDLRDIPPLERFVADGALAEWGDAGYRIDLMIPPDAPLPARSDLNAAARLGWTAQGLAVRIEVQDDHTCEAEDSSLWSRDSIEFFMGLPAGGREYVQWVIAPGRDPRHPALRKTFMDQRVAKRGEPAEFEVAAAVRPDGYALEALVPWTALGIEAREGARFRFQFYVTDKDDENDTRIRTTWYPAGETHAFPERMHACRLAAAPSPADASRHSATVQLDRFQLSIRSVASADNTGSTVTWRAGGRVLAAGTLARHASTYACFEKTIPLPLAVVTAEVAIADAPPVPVVLPSGEREVAERMVFMATRPESCVFEGPKLPKLDFEYPLWAERALGGGYETAVTYYDSASKEVTEAAMPGRYGAVMTVRAADGRTLRRFATLYRVPKQVRWWHSDLRGRLDLPPETGIRPEATARFADPWSDFLKWSVVDRFSRDDAGGVVFAALAESGESLAPAGYYDDPWQRDRQWWVGVKRKLYGWDKRWPSGAYSCPTVATGGTARVVRWGTAAEAGMKPDAAAQIDAVLRAWAADTDEAFAVCVARRGVIVLHEAYGLRKGQPMTVDTRSWMASITKLLCGSMLMTFVDRGLIDLEAPVGDYLPPLRQAAGAKPLLVKHLVTHTSGLDWHWGAEDDDMEERLAALLPHLKIGEAYGYNGTGFNLATKIMEAVSGESMPELYRRHLLGPLGCEHTDVGDGGGGCLSTPLDMARIGQMLLNRGAYGPWRFMGETGYAKLLPRKLTDILGAGTTSVYGAGTSLYEKEGLGAGTFGHGAASSATLRIDPENELIIVMTRDAAGRNFSRYHQRFIDAVVAGIGK